MPRKVAAAASRAWVTTSRVKLVLTRSLGFAAGRVRCRRAGAGMLPTSGGTDGGGAPRLPCIVSRQRSRSAQKVLTAPAHKARILISPTNMVHTSRVSGPGSPVTSAAECTATPGVLLKPTQLQAPASLSPD
jgi:hypothetical protein